MGECEYRCDEGWVTHWDEFWSETVELPCPGCNDGAPIPIPSPSGNAIPAEW